MDSLVHTLKVKASYKKPLIVGVSGIDGSGKGYVSAIIKDKLRAGGVNCALIGIDGWLDVPSKRFSENDPAQHFYKNGFRFAEMKKTVMEPLWVNGSLDVKAMHSDPTGSEDLLEYHYRIEKADIIIFEGIFLFQDMFEFDYRIWIDCSFKTALERALVRNQEGLSPEEIRRDFDKIYFAAQSLHFEKDNPRKRADFFFLNDDNFKEFEVGWDAAAADIV